MEAGLKKKELNEVVERCLQYYKRGKPPGGKNWRDFFLLAYYADTMGWNNFWIEKDKQG